MSRAGRHKRSPSAAVGALAAVILLLVAARPVRAQGQPAPSPAGSATSATPAERGHSLGASLQVGGGWTRQTFVDAQGVEPVRSGRHASGAASLQYGFQGRRSAANASASSSVFHAPSFANDLRYAHSGQAGFSRQLSRRTSFDAN